MYLKWQGQFWRACCSSASSASDGAAERALCWWLLGAGLCCCSLTAQQADVGDALADPTGRETTPCCIPGLAGKNGRRGCSDGRRRLEAHPSSCTQKKCLLGALWRKSSVSIPFPCYLLLRQLAQSVCHSPGFCWAVCRPVRAVPIHVWDFTFFSGPVSVKTCHSGMTATLFSSCHCSCCKQ